MTLTWETTETTTAAARDCEVQPDTPQQPGTPPLAVHDGGLRSAGAGSTDKGSLLQQSSTTQRRPAARSLVEFHGRSTAVAYACTRPRRRVQSSSGVAVGDGRCRCRVRVLCSCDLLRVPFPRGARRGVMRGSWAFGGSSVFRRSCRVEPCGRTNLLMASRGACDGHAKKMQKEEVTRSVVSRK